MMKLLLLLFSAILLNAGCSSTHRTDTTNDTADTIYEEPVDKTNMDVPVVPDSIENDTSHFNH